MTLLSRRQVVAALFSRAVHLGRGNVTRADHEYVAIVTNTQLSATGALGMVGTTLVVLERPASPQYLEGCNGVLMPAFHVRIARDGDRHQHLLVGIDTTFHPDPTALTSVQSGDHFVVRKSGSGDCGDGTSLLYLEPVPAS